MCHVMNRKENFNTLKTVALTPYPRKSFILQKPNFPKTQTLDHTTNISEKKLSLSKDDWIYMHKNGEIEELTTKKALQCYSKFVCKRYFNNL